MPASSRSTLLITFPCLPFSNKNWLPGIPLSLNRVFRTSSITPFAAKMVWERMKCNNAE